jgi:predicted RecB family nuclease
MQITEDGRVITSPSDLSAWASCEWAFLRRLDAKLGRAEPIPDEPDEMLKRTAILGDEHERRYLAELERDHDVLSFERPTAAEYQQAARAAADAMRAGQDALYQAAFSDDEFIGFADFIVRNDRGEYEVYDTKLARHAKISALLQLAAYAEQIERLGIPVGGTVWLVLGNGKKVGHELADIAPVYRVQHAEMRRQISERLTEHEPLAWGDPRYASCGRCTACATQTEEHRDLVLVAGMRLDQRAKLIAAGIRTIDDLAASDARTNAIGTSATGTNATTVPGLGARALAKLRAQASLQIESEQDQRDHPGEQHRPPAYRLTPDAPQALAQIPQPDEGDIFFDFEGDPLYTEDNREWGLDYLFGLVDDHNAFTPFWAHTIAEEREALRDFLAFVEARRKQHPGMHIYHYAPYEKTHLLSIAERHQLGIEQVDDLLRANVLVDLYPIVRKALLIGSHSYSIKKLEPLYMGDELRDDMGVTNAADSITAYVDAITELREGDPVHGQRKLDEVADYNAYDCRSTLALRDWLLSLRPAATTVPLGTQPESAESEAPVPPEPNPVFVELSDRLAGVDPATRTADQTALALAAAAIDYHRREGKKFWQEHFDRLRNPIEDWADTRDVFVVERASVEQDWLQEGRKATARTLRLSGTLAPGSRLRSGGTPWVLYEDPAPESVGSRSIGMRGDHSRATILDVDDDGSTVLITERLPKGGEEYPDVPVALAPSSPPPLGALPGAIADWGRTVLDALPAMLPDPALDLLRREPPRGPIAPIVADDTVGAVAATLLGLDRSYLAIQGPPGTGKTYVGSRVVAKLVNEYGWRIGVVGNSHKTSENFLDAVIEAGVPGERVRKQPKAGTDDEYLESVPWTPVKNGAELASFLAACREDGRGGVVAGTAWTFANESYIGRGELDLLVVDEAGQFSLAATIASAVAATRLLLLGDPQQLPQVSQGSHPEPVDQSALGWLADGHDVLPPEFGYFLAHTRRMHPALTAAVSALSYDGALTSIAPPRVLDGVAPGLHAEPVLHHGNVTESVEEAARAVSIAESMIGRTWTDESGTRSLTDEDVIIVAPYNAQGALIRASLDAAGLTGTQVGTVDLFQGREAVVAIVSLAASSAADIPRGLDFLLMPNRLNVAISRAKWAAFLIYSPGLTTSLPTSIPGVALLSRFIGLVEGADS